MTTQPTRKYRRLDATQVYQLHQFLEPLREELESRPQTLTHLATRASESLGFHVDDAAIKRHAKAMGICIRPRITKKPRKGKTRLADVERQLAKLLRTTARDHQVLKSLCQQLDVPFEETSATDATEGDSPETASDTPDTIPITGAGA